MIRLLELPMEVWWVLNGQLHFWHIMRLYMCGNRRLIDLMTRRGAVTDICICINGSDPKLGWIPQISEFTHVRRFTYDCGDCSGTTRYVISTEDLKMIGPSVREVHIFADSAETSFLLTRTKSPDSGTTVESHGPRLIISDLWPNLVHFAISTFLELQEWSPSEIDLLKSLPPTLTSLTNENHLSPSDEVFKCLPRDIVHLRVPHFEIKEEQLLLLPPQLETLTAGICDSHYLEDSEVAEYWGKLPPGLRHLEIDNTYKSSDLPVALLSHLPLSLTHLSVAKIVTSNTFAAVAKRYRHLKCLSITHPANVSSWTSNQPETLALKHIPKIIQSLLSYEPGTAWTFQDNEWILANKARPSRFEESS